MCTECFLQVRPQKEKACVCPFCNNPKLYVSAAKKLDSGQLHERQAEEQRAIELQIQAQNIHNTEQFGATLEHRIRSQSNGCAASSNEGDPMVLLRQLSMSETDRQAIEREMRAQHTHPLALQMQAEAEERRSRNEREYYRTHSAQIREAALMRASRLGGGSGRRLPRGSSSRSSGTSQRHWNDIVNAFERGGGDQGTSLDDLVVLEAAILLSMEEEARREGSGEVPPGSSFSASQHARHGFPLVQQLLNARSDHRGLISGRAFQGLSEDEQIAMAIALSMQEPSESETSAESEDNKVKTNSTNEDTNEDDAVAESGESSQPLTNPSAGVERVGTQSESTTDRAATSESEDDESEERLQLSDQNLPAVYFEEARRNVAALDSDDSNSRLPAAYFDDSDPKLPAAYFEDSDQKMPASYFDDSDRKMPAVCFDDSDQKMPALCFDDSDQKMPAVCFDDSNPKLPASYFDDNDRKMPAVCFDDSDRKMPASYFDDSDQKMPVSYFDDSDQKMPAVYFDDSDQKIPAVNF
jgi:Ubiquitin interaction motif